MAIGGTLVAVSAQTAEIGDRYGRNKKEQKLRQFLTPKPSMTRRESKLPVCVITILPSVVGFALCLMSMRGKAVLSVRL
ncbi:MAG: hypothetical protein PUG41_06335 [Prevotellaceae bacterium]|nr:hypothetical protein [Prevotellaceae bacterium]